METEVIQLRFGDETSDLPAWSRDIFYDEQADIFVVSTLSISPGDLVTYQATHPDELTEIIELNDGHKYIPLSLAEKVAPQNAAFFAQIEKKLRQVVAEIKKIPQTVHGWPVDLMH